MTDAQAKKAGFERIEGYVWCHRHGEVHEDGLDPYSYGPPDPGHDDDRCQPEDHEPIYQPRKP